MRFLASQLANQFKVLSTIDIRNDSSTRIDTRNDSTSFEFPVIAKFPLTSSVFPSLTQSASAGEGSSIEPLTMDSLPLLSQLRRDYLEGVPTGLMNPSDNLSPRGWFSSSLCDIYQNGQLSLCDSNELHTNCLDIGYRYFSDPTSLTSFSTHSFALSNAMVESLFNVCNRFDLLTTFTLPYYSYHLFSYSWLGSGFRAVVNEENPDQCLVEVITNYNGIFGRMIILVSMGLCSTIWYKFISSNRLNDPTFELYQKLPSSSYQEFFRNPEDAHLDNFHKMSVIESLDITDEVINTISNVYPLTEMNPPTGGFTGVAVGYGLMLALNLAIRGVPDEDNSL